MVGENNANSEEGEGQDIPAERDKRALIRQIKHDLQNGGDYEAVKNPLATSSTVWNDGNFLVICNKGSETHEDFAVCVRCFDLKSYKLEKSPSNFKRHLEKCSGIGTVLSPPTPPTRPPELVPVTINPKIKTDFKEKKP